MEPVVFHSSPRQGLYVIQPKSSSHGSVLYACKDKVFSALFLGRCGGDLTCSLFRRDGIPHVVERFPQAFEVRYGNKGSIYTLPAETFSPLEDPWEEEVVSRSEVMPLHEEQVPSSLNYLTNLASQGMLRMVRFQDREGFVPGGDLDLVDKIVKWCKAGKARFALEDTRNYHPDLYELVVQRLRGPE